MNRSITFGLATVLIAGALATGMTSDAKASAASAASTVQAIHGSFATASIQAAPAFLPSHGFTAEAPSASPRLAAAGGWWQWGFSLWPAPHFWMKASVAAVLGGIVFWGCTRYAPWFAAPVCGWLDSLARRLAANAPGGIWFEYYLGGYTRAGVW